MQAYGNHIQGQSWGGYLAAGVSVSVSYPSDTTANITVTGRCGFYWIDAWSNSSITVTLGGVSGSGSYSGAIHGGTGNENYIVDSSESASKTFTVNRGTSNTDYTGYCTLVVGGQTSTASYKVTVNKIPYSACGAPTSVSASGIVTPSGSFTVSWSGASGGTSNAISSYQVYYKVSSNGTAPTTSDYTGTTNVTSTATSGSTTITLSSATRGYKVVCGVVTRGAAGSSYYSGIKTGGSVTINSLPATPSITSPTAATNTYVSTTTSVDITVSPGADIDSTQTTSVWYATSTTGTKTQVTNNTLTVSMTAGTSYTRYFWTYDGLEYSSNYASVTIRRNSAPSLSLGTATNTAKSCGVSSFDNTKYIVGVTLPITGTKGTYGSASTLYYRVVYGTIGGTNNNPSYTSVTTTSGTAYSLTLNLNSIIGAPNKQWYIEYYYHDGIQETAHAFYPAKSGSTINYYYLAPSPSISAKYNQQANSNITGTQSGQFYQKVRLKYTYDTDLTAVSKVTYRIGTGAESNATINSSAYSATSGTNNIDITLPNSLTPNTTYTFTVYVTNGSFNKTFTTTMVQAVVPSLNSLSETPATWKPYTYNGSMIFNVGITGVSGTNFYTTNNLDSASCFKVYFKKGSSKIEIPWSNFTTSTSTDTLQATCNCATNGATLLSLTKTNNPLGSDYNTNYSISWVFEITNLFGKVISFETPTTYKIDFYESVTQPTIKVELSNSAGSVWTELTANEGWRPQETGKFRFTSTCTSYNTTSISSIIQINRSSSTTQGSWSDYDKVSTQAMTRSGSVGFLTPYTFTRIDTVTIPELTTNDYVWFRSKVTRGSETALTSAASKRTRLIYHYQATNFVLNSAEYAGGSTLTFTGSANCSVTGAGYSASEYTQTWEKKLLLSSTNTWTTSAESSMYTKVLTTGSNSTIPTATTYSVLASDLSTNPGTSWERLYTKIKLTTTITQTVGTVTITTTKVTYTEPYLITYNTLPTILYKKNKLGINTKSITSSEALAIHSATNNQSVNVYLDNGQIGSISLSNGTLSKFIVGGGTWTGTTAAATSTINQLVIKKGAAAPTTNNLTSYEVGYATNTQTLYINDNGTIRPIGNSAIAQMALTGSYNLNELTVGNLVVTGNASFTNNIQVNTINGVTVGSNPKFTDNNTTYSAGTGLSLSSTTFSLATSGATAGSYGPSSNASPAHSGTFSVPYITVDAYGRVTAASTKTITLPASGNTDTKVKITAVNPASETSYYPLMYTATSGTVEVNAHENDSNKIRKGTTSQEGWVIHQLGNNKTYDTDGNSKGYIRLYGSSTGYGQITYTNSTANTTHVLPANEGMAGTILEIVEEGTWGDHGRYIKYSNGMAECYGWDYKTTAISSTYGSGGICYTTASAIFPSGLFIAGPAINITIERSSGLCWASIYNSSASKVDFFIGSATAEVSAKIYFHVIAKGKWK